MKKILIKFFSTQIFIFPLKVIIHLLLKNSYLVQIQQKMNNYDVLTNEFQMYLYNKNKNILDIGCSTGNVARAIIDMSNNNYYGIDISKKYIERAKRNRFTLKRGIKINSKGLGNTGISAMIIYKFLFWFLLFLVIMLIIFFNSTILIY